MGKIIVIQSFRGGVGKSMMIANLASLMVESGKKIGILDCDIKSPSQHILFNIDLKNVKNNFNDFLEEKCSIDDVVYHQIENKLIIFPASPDVGDIAKISRDGFNSEKLVSGILKIIQKYNLDYLFIDTHSGLNKETLLSISIANKLIVLISPDQKDFKNTLQIIELAKKLNVSNIFLIANKFIPSKYFKEKVKDNLKSNKIEYIPYSQDLMLFDSTGIFVKKFPHHLITKKLNNLIKLL